MKNKITAIISVVYMTLLLLPPAANAAEESAIVKYSSLTPKTTNITSVRIENSSAGLDEVTAGDEKAVKLTAANSIYDSVLIDIDSSFMRALKGDVVDVAVTYYDEGDATFLLRYDGRTNSSKETELVTLENTCEWKTYTFRLYDARFGNGLSNADLELSLFSERIGLNSSYLIFKSIEIKRTGQSFPINLTENLSSGNLFAKGMDANLSFSAKNLTGETINASYDISITDHNGIMKNSGGGTIQFASGVSSVQIPTEITECGAYDARIVFYGDNELYGEYKTNFAIAVSASKNSADFGVNTHFAKIGGGRDPVISMPIVSKLGAGIIRDEIPWTLCETQKGEIQIPDNIMDAVNEAVNNGIEVLLILGYTNSFYDDGQFPQSDEAIEAFGNYVYNVVSELKGKVNYFNVMNEFAHGNGMNNQELAYQNAPKYVKVLKEAYMQAKKANPDCTVVGLSGLPGLWPFWTDAMFDAGAADYLDAIDLHEYCHSDTEMVQNIKNIQAVLDEHNISDMDIWITELGTSATQAETVENRCAFSVRKSVVWKKMGVDKQIWYDFENDGLIRTDTEMNFGLVYNNHDIDKVPYSANPVYVAFANMNDKIGNAAIEAYSESGDGTQIYRFMRDDGRKVWVLWNTTADITTNVSVGERDVELYDMYGNMQQLSNESGAYDIAVSSEPVYLTEPGCDMKAGITSINYATGEISVRITDIDPNFAPTIEVFYPNKTQADFYTEKGGALCWISQTPAGRKIYEFTFTATVEGEYTIYANTGNEIIEIGAAYYKDLGATVSLWQNGSEIKDFSSLTQNDPITAKAVIDNSNAASANYMFFIALYKGDRLCKIETNNGEILPTDPVKTPEITITPNSEYDSVSVFIWKDKTRLIPIMDKFNLSKQ